jgi:hypothetical protein
MKKPDNVHDALRHIDSLLADVMRTVDDYTEPFANRPKALIHVNAATADARLLALWVRDQLKTTDQQGLRL